MTKHTFNSSVLREYDIRGIVGETLSERDAYAVGRCFGTIVRDRGGKLVTVGRDGRLSSEEFEKATVKGLMECGLKVLTLGLVPTPMVYFSEYQCEADGAIMITGSHNPMNHNGFKLSLGKRSFYGQDIKNFARLASLGSFAQGTGISKPYTILRDYINTLSTDFQDNYSRGRALKVAWDGGNGVTGPIIENLISHLPGDHILLNKEVDGTFPNHHPDPQIPENLVQLQKTVIENGCDLGIAFDGDGDRIGAIHEKGTIIWGDQLLLLFSEEVLQKNPGASIIGDVKASQVFFDGVKKLGGIPIMGRTGHSLIKKKIREVGAHLAGEMSGHVFFKDRYYGFDDALYAAIRLIGITSLMKNPLSVWHEGIPKLLNTPEIRIHCEDHKKFEVVNDIKKRLQSSKIPCIDIDGVRVQTKEGWWLLRASNTGASLIARVEATSQDGLEKLSLELKENLAQSGIDLSL